MPVLTLRQDGRETKIEFVGTPRLADLLMGHGAGLPATPAVGAACAKMRGEGPRAPGAPNSRRKTSRHAVELQTILLGDCTVTLPPSHRRRADETQGPSISLSPNIWTAMAGEYGAAVDIGTTTMALTVHALDSGACAAQAACLNLKAKFPPSNGADRRGDAG